MKFKIGDTVRTSKGGRMRDEGSFVGEITGFSKWRHYEAVNIKKTGRDGNKRIVQCLLKNIERL